MELTAHASRRRQQRGIAYPLMELLYQFGSIHYHRGMEVYSIDKEAAETLKTEVSYSAQIIEKLLTVYMGVRCKPVGHAAFGIETRRWSLFHCQN